MRRRLAVAALALSAIALAGCPRKPPPPLSIQKISVSAESLNAAPALGLGPRQMQDQVEAALKKQGAVLLKPDAESSEKAPGFRLHAEVESARLDDVPYDDGGVGQEAVVELALDAIRSSSEGTEKLSGSAAGRVPTPQTNIEDQAQAFKQAFARALELSTSRLVRAAAASQAPTEQLHEQLKSSDPGLREAAADVLVDRKDLLAIPVLIQELDSKDDDVRMKAIGELVELRAREAVPKLIDLAQTRDPRLGADPHFQMQIIYALGSIGGGEAEAYLYTIASGHPDEMVRNAAREASNELQHTRKAAPEKKP